ncbi:MAG: hypothetical protein EP344_03455 [Bacteroidetes bacterium]|nr:MAG: hypothetical protein EP344_03455 [Bacteroidota bacterium]
MKTTSLLFLLLLPLYLLAQPGPRVGVVLSGGGAKGVAHVGALRVIEEAGIRIDYIGGSSMGGIVGGLYAAGWSVDQLDSILRANDLSVVLQDEVKRDYQPFFNKIYGEKYALRLSFKDFKISLPPALSDGQEAFNFLSALTDHVVGITDFSQLPTPFLCIGTDVSAGKQVILEKGCLARAMRASGSFPGLLAPVEVDSQLITDGAVVNNFPAKEVHDKGMDFIIGVSVEADLYSKDELTSMEKIIEQIGSYQMIARSQDQLTYCNLVIRPALDEYGVTSFDAIDTIMVRGERAARLQWDSLVSIARLQHSGPEAPYKRPDLVTEQALLQVGTVRLEDNPAITYKALVRKFPQPFPGTISFDKFREGIAALYATDNFQFIDYHFEPQVTGQRELVMHLKVKPGYESSLRLGLHYDKVYKSSLLLNGTFRNVVFQNSIAALDLIIGDKLRYNAHYYVGGGRTPGAGFNSRLNTVDLPIDLPVRIDIGDSISIQSLLFNMTDHTQELYANLLTNEQFALGVAAELKYFKTATEQAVDYISERNYVDEKGWYAGARAFLHFDNRDRIFFTQRGALIRIAARGFKPITSLKYDDIRETLGWNFDIQARLFHPLSEHLTAVFIADAGRTLGTPAPPYRYFLGSNNRNLINNFRPFTGLAFARISGNNLFKAGLTLQYKLLKTHYFSLTGELASLGDDPQPFSSGHTQFRSIGLSYGISTPLGPVEVTYGRSNKESEWYFTLGYWF